MSKEREPWDCVPQWKNEKQFLNWLRSSVRRIWSKHPIKIEYKKSRRYKAPLGKITKRNPEGMVWVSDCEVCGKASRTCDVDHIDGGYGFTAWEEFTEWAKRILWVTFDDIREVCKPCHQIINHMQKTGLSWDEAVKDKQRIEFFKQSVTKQKEQLKEWGASEDDLRNDKNRRRFYEQFK